MGPLARRQTLPAYLKRIALSVEIHWHNHYVFKVHIKKSQSCQKQPLPMKITMHSHYLSQLLCWEIHLVYSQRCHLPQQ